jgi:hypothetical protein
VNDQIDERDAGGAAVPDTERKENLERKRHRAGAFGARQKQRQGSEAHCEGDDAG